MILCIGTTKGGAGKSTLAVNLTIASALNGHDVLLIDGDEQRTALTFTDLRTEQLGQAGYTAVALTGIAIRNQVRQLAPKYDDIIVDVGGRDTGSFRAALIVADVLLIPVLPRSFDLWAVDQVIDLIKDARELNENLRAVAVVNMADPQGQDNDDTAQALAKLPEIELLPITIGRRKAFPNAATSGHSVLEHTPKDPKAVQEIEQLVSALWGAKG